MIYDIDRNKMLRFNDHAFESSDDRADNLSKKDFERNTTESTTDRSFLLRRLDEHDSRVAILAHSASLSARLVELMTRERAQKRR